MTAPDLIECCARANRSQFGHAVATDWWERMDEGARQHWRAGTRAVLTEFLAYVREPEMVEKIVNLVCNMHRWIFDETTRYHVVDDFKDILDALTREVSGETNPRAQK